MAETPHFTTGFRLGSALYPGGSSQNGIVFTDPYPDGVPAGNIFKASFTAEEAGAVLEKVWNMKEWDVQFAFELAADFTFDGGSEPDFTVTPGAQGNMTGKFHGAAIGFSQTFSMVEYSYRASVADQAPMDRVCGKEYGRDISDAGLGLNDVTFEENHPRLLPACFIGHTSASSPSATYSGSVDVSSRGGASGELTLSGISGVEGSAFGECRILQMHLQEDGELDVFFTAGAYILDFAAGLAQLFNAETTTEDVDTFFEFDTVSFADVSLTFLGKTLPGKVFFFGEFGYETAALNTFSWSYDIEVTDYWTYPVASP